MLVADSYDGARIPCVKYLGRLGFGVLEAGGGHQALAHINAMTADVVLLESGLPNASVEHVVRRLSERPTAVPLIVMAGALDALEDTVARMPLVAVLEKPFSLTTMLEEIRRLIRAQPADLAETI